MISIFRNTSKLGKFNFNQIGGIGGGADIYSAVVANDFLHLSGSGGFYQKINKNGERTGVVTGGMGGAGSAVICSSMGGRLIAASTGSPFTISVSDNNGASWSVKYTSTVGFGYIVSNFMGEVVCISSTASKTVVSSDNGDSWVVSASSLLGGSASFSQWGCWTGSEFLICSAGSVYVAASVASFVAGTASSFAYPSVRFCSFADGKVWIGNASGEIKVSTSWSGVFSVVSGFYSDFNTGNIGVNGVYGVFGGAVAVGSGAAAYYEGGVFKACSVGTKLTDTQRIFSIVEFFGRSYMPCQSSIVMCSFVV